MIISARCLRYANVGRSKCWSQILYGKPDISRIDVDAFLCTDSMISSHAQHMYPTHMQLSTD